MVDTVSIISLSQRLSKVKSEVSNLEFKHSHMLRMIDDYKTKIHEFSAKIQLAQSTITVLELWLRQLSDSGIKQVEALVNQGLRYIFNDRALRFIINVSEGSNQVEFYIHDLEINDISAIDEVGGGVIVVVSFLLNIIFLFVYQCRPFLILDEALSQISDIYLERAFQFIKLLVAEYKFDILIVTHDDRIKSYADKIYYVTQGGNVRLLKE